MHELSIALNIVDIVAAEAERHQYAHVAVVHLRLGALSGVLKNALESAYPLACAGTCVDGSELVIEEIPLTVYCPTCAAERTLSNQQLLCPVCATPTPEIVRGRELDVVALEIDV